MAFSDTLIFLRRNMNLSQEELGERVGVSRQTISKWETGQTTPDLNKLIELSRLFGCTLDELAGQGTPAPHDAPPAPEPSHDVPAPWGFRYRSRRTLLGLPLVSVNIGLERHNRAVGIIAIGNEAVGLISIGAASMGLISIGIASLGLLALGGAAVGLCAIGGVATGLWSLGGVAVGKIAVGGVVAGDVAVGGVAAGRIAIGDTADGMFSFARTAPIDRIADCIRENCPSAPGWLYKILPYFMN